MAGTWVSRKEGVELQWLDSLTKRGCRDIPPVATVPRVLDEQEGVSRFLFLFVARPRRHSFADLLLTGGRTDGRVAADLIICFLCVWHLARCSWDGLSGAAGARDRIIDGAFVGSSRSEVETVLANHCCHQWPGTRGRRVP